MFVGADASESGVHISLWQDLYDINFLQSILIKIIQNGTVHVFYSKKKFVNNFGLSSARHLFLQSGRAI